jgi:flavin-dependent dehydrogenase
MKVDYDVITVGGGLGGAALAKVLAENGVHVLVVERETTFKDRVRGNGSRHGASRKLRSSACTNRSSSTART